MSASPHAFDLNFNRCIFEDLRRAKETRMAAAKAAAAKESTTTPGKIAKKQRMDFDEPVDAPNPVRRSLFQDLPRTCCVTVDFIFQPSPVTNHNHHNH